MGADNLAKIPQIPHNLFAQFVCPSPKVLDFNEKRLHWVSVVRGLEHTEKDKNVSDKSTTSSESKKFYKIM